MIKSKAVYVFCQLYSVGFFLEFQDEKALVNILVYHGVFYLLYWLRMGGQQNKQIEKHAKDRFWIMFYHSSSVCDFLEVFLPGLIIHLVSLLTTILLWKLLKLVSCPAGLYLFVQSPCLFKLPCLHFFLLKGCLLYNRYEC